MDFQNVLKENNSQPSAQKLNGSLSDADTRELLEETSDVLKENYNPKSLSEIATDKTSKLITPVSENYPTSTPKITKTLFKSQDSSDCDPDCTIELTPTYQREPLSTNHPDISLGFLTEGLTKLDLDRHNSLHVADLHGTSAFSDDDEQFVECQSFTDSNRPSFDTSDVLMRTVGRNSTITKETAGADVSGNLDSELQNLNSTQPAAGGSFKIETPNLNSTQTASEGSFKIGSNLNSTQTGRDGSFTQNLNSTQTAADGTFDVASQNLNSTAETPADGTFNAGSQSFNSSKAPADGTFDAGSQSLNSTQTPSDGTFNTGNSLNSTATLDQVEPRASTESSDNFGSCSASSKSVEDVAQRHSDFVEQELPQNHELPEGISCTPTVGAEKQEEGNNAVQTVHEECVLTSPEAGKIQKVASPEPRAEEIVLPELQAEEVVQQVQIEQTKLVKSPTPEAPEPEAEEYFQNIDDISKSQIADKIEAAFSTEPKQPQVQQNPFSPVKQTAESVFFDKVQSQFDVQFKKPAVSVFKQSAAETFADDEFNCGSSYNFADSDFDYLQKFGSSKAVRNSLFQRDSLLLKFDPLCAQNPTPAGAIDKRLTATTEEDDFVADLELKLPQQEQQPSANNSLSPNASLQHEQSSRQLPPAEDESMSVEIMKDISAEHKTSESNHIEVEAESKLSSHNYEENHLKMAELENKIKKEAEIREEALLKRISEKDKQISKMNGVVEAYEKAISELIAEKEQLVQSYEKKCNDLKYDSEQNAHHLTSLETTFSDLHSKYERTKQIATELKDREEHIISDRKTLTDSLKMQEARYEKMKSHAMSQLEIANTTLAEQNRNHNAEVTKYKALLKKEEVSRASINEQLIQKTKENSELVKICDELINGAQSS